MIQDPADLSGRLKPLPDRRQLPSHLSDLCFQLLNPVISGINPHLNSIISLIIPIRQDIQTIQFLTQLIFQMLLAVQSPAEVFQLSLKGRFGGLVANGRRKSVPEFFRPRQLSKDLQHCPIQFALVIGMLKTAPAPF